MPLLADLIRFRQPGPKLRVDLLRPREPEEMNMITR
jgi:hypothetical protein